MLNDAVVNDWLVRSPFVKAKKGELIAVTHEASERIKSNYCSWCTGFALLSIRRDAVDT